jgi:lipoate-protein ligase A
MAGYGIPGVLLDIESKTCYELGKAMKAYKGEFENQTDLRLDLVKKVINLRNLNSN